jgi:hypothetical protein
MNLFREAVLTRSEPLAASTDPASGSPSPAFGIPGAGLPIWCWARVSNTRASTAQAPSATGASGAECRRPGCDRRPAARCHWRGR